MIETIKAVKDYGVIALFVFALVWMNSKMSTQDNKIEQIESRLYDCFEQRIKDNSFKNLMGTKQAVIDDRKMVAILPEEIKIKRA